MNRRKMLLSTLGSTLAVNGVSIAAASTPPLFQRESLPQEFSKVISPGKLRILVLSGSPHKDGTTNLLATNFVKGAKEAGHEVRHVTYVPCRVIYYHFIERHIFEILNIAYACHL